MYRRLSASHPVRISTAAYAAVLIGLVGPAKLWSQTAPEGRVALLDSLHAGLGPHWIERDLGRGATEYRVVRDGGVAVLRATSAGSASALWRDVPASGVDGSSLSWRWKVQRSLSDNRRERDKRGDDYAARVFVVFGPGAKNLASNRALCYVWAGNQPVGTVFRSPYSRDVAMVVVESGDARAGQWMSVRRMLEADYRKAFGEAPEAVAAVALMVDTDDTQAHATAFFADLVLETASVPTSR